MKKSELLRGAVCVRADAVTSTEILAKLTQSFQDYQAANDERIKAIEANKADPLLEEKISKAAAEVMDLQAQLNVLAVKIEAAAIVNDKSGRVVKDAEYSADFEKHIRGAGGQEFTSEKLTKLKAQYSQGTPSEGGYFAPTEWDRTVENKLKIIGDFRRLASSRTIGVNSFSRVINKKGTGSGWVAEGAARPATTNSALDQIVFNTYELYALVNATQTILDDAEIDMEQWLTDEVQEEFSYQENLAFVSGSGAGRPKGLLTYATGGTNAAAHPLGAISVVPSLAAAGVTLDGIQNLITELPSKFAADASFIMNRKTQGEVMKLKNADGTPYWQPSLALGQPANIRGWAVNEISDMPDVTANALAIGFGDWARTYLIIDRIGMRVLRDPYSNKPFVQFYCTKRVGGGVQNPETAKLMKISAT